MRILKELAHKHRDGRSGREGQHDASHGDDHGMTRLLGDNAVKKVDEDVSETYDETDNEDMLKEEHQRKNYASEDRVLPLVMLLTRRQLHACIRVGSWRGSHTCPAKAQSE